MESKVPWIWKRKIEGIRRYKRNELSIRGATDVVGLRLLLPKAISVDTTLVTMIMWKKKQKIYVLSHLDRFQPDVHFCETITQIGLQCQDIFEAVDLISNKRFDLDATKTTQDLKHTSCLSNLVYFEREVKYNREFDAPA